MAFRVSGVFKKRDGNLWIGTRVVGDLDSGSLGLVALYISESETTPVQAKGGGRVGKNSGLSKSLIRNSSFPHF